MPEAKYDPKQPATIHNPVPREQWPYIGRVYGIDRALSVGNPSIQEGIVHFYQPALHGNYLVTKGHPTLTIRTLQGGYSCLCGVEDVRPHTEKGRRELEDILWAEAIKIAEDHEARAQRIRDEIELLRVQRSQADRRVKLARTKRRRRVAACE